MQLYLLEKQRSARNGKQIFYSLDTFFQANLSILPCVLTEIEKLIDWSSEVNFYDLYAGVGLFGILLADRVHHVTLIEENKASVELARFNMSYHDIKNIEIQVKELPLTLELKE